MVGFVLKLGNFRNAEVLCGGKKAPLAQHLAVSLRLTVPALYLYGGYAAQRRSLESKQRCR
jgi:hypothetical protein